MLAAIDFTTVEVWTKSGLVTIYLLFVMELKTRRIHFAGCTANPHEAWMKQAARELTNCEDGLLVGKRYLVMDRDEKFSAAFRGILSGSGVKALRLPPRSPNLNAHLERFFLSLKSECLERMIFFGERSLRNAVGDFVAHISKNAIIKGWPTRSSNPAMKLAVPTERFIAASGSAAS